MTGDLTLPLFPQQSHEAPAVAFAPLPTGPERVGAGPVRILQVRGTNGSGKSTLVRALLRTWGGGPAVAVVPGYGVRVTHPDWGVLTALGSYPPTGLGGGCDTIQTQDDVCQRVRDLAAAGSHVVFEGIIATSVFGRYVALSAEMRALGHRYLTTFLQPPMAVCVARVQARRDAKGRTAPFNPTNLEAKWGLTAGHLRHFAEAGSPVLVLNWKDPLPQLLDFFTAGVE